MMVNLSKQ